VSYLFAIASAVLYGGADFLGGIGSRRASTIAIVVVSQGAGLVSLVCLLPVLPEASPSTMDVAWGGVAGLAGGVGVALLYRALAVGQMSVVAPITAVCAVMIPVGAGVVSGDRLTVATMVGIGVAMVAIVMVSQQTASADAAPRQGALPAGVWLALASGVAIGVFFLALARSGPMAGMWPLVGARAASVALFALMAIGRRQSLRLTRPVLGLAVAAGLVDMCAAALYLLATRGGSLSVVATLASLYPAGTVLLARLVLGERLNGWQAAGVVAAVVAIALIVGGDAPRY